MLRTLGKGSFGKVKEALHVISGEKIAIKILEKDKIQKEDDLLRIRREIDILRRVRHANIIQLYEVRLSEQVIETGKYFFFVMECAEKGELSDYIESREKYPLLTRLAEEESARFFRQLASAIRYLHAMGCAHRDIKPSNILIDWKLNIKVIDFGLGNLYDEHQKLKTACGSPCYAAPEVRAAHPDHLRRTVQPHQSRHLEQRHHALRDALRVSPFRRREQVCALRQNPRLQVQPAQVAQPRSGRPAQEDAGARPRPQALPRRNPGPPLHAQTPQQRASRRRLDSSLQHRCARLTQTPTSADSPATR